MFDHTERVPPIGTMCQDCGCCPAGIFAGEGADRVGICMACDEGVPCAHQRAAAALAAKFPNLLVPPPLASAPEPAAASINEPEPTPEPETTTMPELTCKGGCGKTVDKPGFAWGHKNGCEGKPKTAPRSAPPSPPEAEHETEDAEVAINFTAPQLERIWAMLPLEEKALAIQTALCAERE